MIRRMAPANPLAAARANPSSSTTNEGCGWRLLLGSLILVALLSRLAYLWRLGHYIGGDEAVGGLMALKIAEGQEFPLLLWEAHYAGTLISYLGAILFLFFEPSPFNFRLAALPLVLVGIAAVAGAAHTLWGRGPALAAASWLALGSPLLNTVSTQAIGGYPEVLCFGGLTLWLGVRLCQSPPRHPASPWPWLLLGAAGGFGTYSLAFAFPVFAGTLWALQRHRGGLYSREGGWIAAGFLLGFAPFLVHNVVHAGASAFRLAGRVLDISRVDLSHASVVSLAIDRGSRYLLRLLGFPWTVGGNLPVFLGLSPWAAWGGAVMAAGGMLLIRRRQDLAPGNSTERLGLALIGWCGLAGLLFLCILGLDRPRHLFAFYLLAPLGLAAFWKRLAGGCPLMVGWGGLALVLLSNFSGTMHDARTAEPRVAVLVDALRSRDIRFVYTDYFIAYPLAFLSRETIVASPVAGPINVERRLAYTQAVAASDRPAYIFLRNTEASAVFIHEMRRKGHPFQHALVDGFDLYLPDRHVRPHDLALQRQF